MRLASFVQLDGKPRLGAVIEDRDGARICDLATASDHYRATRVEGGFVLPADMVEFLKTGDSGLALAREVLDWAVRTGTATAPLEAVQLVAPVPKPPKLLALAGNYQEHIVEGGGTAVDKTKVLPMLFMKPSTTLAGHGQPLVLPRGISQTVDWELEVAVVIGRRAKYVSAETALEHVAGYTIFNDISSRSLEITKTRAESRPRDQFFDWLNGKWQDGFGLMGPYLVTRDEVPDPQNLRLRLSVNDRIRQDGSSAQMIFTIAETIAWASKLFTLEPGDVIATGTPSGVGSASGTFLKAGDVLCAEIEGLGTLVNPVVDEEG
jgi:2-keto-4-pentenoate hydratase/2-oxohepta-3-ene-1,7-dioic acid hydratase in catechol pathway